jgi:putative tryptophan/tyrosine transport system substrate-binding protein
MKRRGFLTLLACGAASCLPSARAAGGRPRIGSLSISTEQYDVRNLAAFRDGLQAFGLIDGRTVDIDYRYSNGDTDVLTALAQDLLKTKPDVVLAGAVSPTRAMKRVAPALPIVCPSFSDGFVPSLAASFAHPGGSVTGIASDVEQLIGKLVEVTLDAMPGTTAIGFLANPAGGSMARFEQQIQSTAQSHGITVQIAQVEKLDDLDGALQKLKTGNVQAVIVPANGLLNSAESRIVAGAAALHLPLINATRDGAVAGGLASYGIDLTDNYRHAAAYVAKILKGTPPGDLPIEFPTAVKLVINLKTAKALGLTLPRSLLDRADEVIE